MTVNDMYGSDTYLLINIMIGKYSVVGGNTVKNNDSDIGVNDANGNKNGTRNMLII